MRGKNGSSRPRGPSIGGESMTTLFNDDPLMHGLALFGNGGQLGLLSHTPPSFAPGSYEVSHMKRARAGSISGRLRSASDLEEKGLIDKTQKGVLKDLIISGDSELQAALDLYDKGDASQLEALMENGLLDRRESFDLLDNLDFGIMELGMSDEEPSDSASNVPSATATVTPTTAEAETVPAPKAKNSVTKVTGASATIAAMVASASASASAARGRATMTVSPPVVAAAAAAAAAAPASEKAAGAAASVNPFRNSGKSGQDAVASGGSAAPPVAAAVAPASSVGQGQRDGGGDGDGGGVGDGGGKASASKAAGGEQEMDLAGEGSGHFDLGEMAFDATFDDEYAEQEDDVDMKDGSGHMPSSSSASAGGTVAAAAAAAAVSTAVGPLRVTGSTSKDKLKLAPPNLISSRGAHHRSDDSDDSDDERPLGRGRVRARARARARRELGEGHEDDSDDDSDDSDTEDSHDGGHGVGGRSRGSGVVMSDDEGGVGGKGAHVDAPGLGSFSTMGAVIGDFSPQFKFSFTDDIHLDLGGGLKDELRDLESFAEHGGPDQHGRGGLGLGHDDMVMGLSASRAQQLLSRGGPAVVKSEMLSSSPSPLGATRSSTAAAASAKAAAAAGATDEGEDVSGSGASGGLSGYATNHYASGAAYNARHTGPYATAEAAAAGGDGEGAEVATATAQARPQGSSAAAVAAAAAAAAASGAQGGNLYGREGAAAAGAATPTHHHTARGRPVVSGMEIMVGGGPRMGMSGGADGEERKFVGAYSPESRRQRIERFLQKREKRVWTKMVKYDVRKNFADTRMRVKGRFVKKEDEALLREVMACA